mmetsp:Transcript_151871/g.268171  ORF Transcript_151871/g.268171 Transcript_151871/m.268171 type:complete len:281 (-) Transcript_151871:265-1107(-)
MQSFVLACSIIWASSGHGWRVQAPPEKVSQNLHVRRTTPSHAFAMLLLTGSQAPSHRPRCTGICKHRAVFMSASPMKDEELCDVQDPAALLEAAEAGFRLLDLNADGSISRDELEKYLLQYRYTGKSVAKIFEEIDSDSSGDVSLDELRESIEEYCGCGQCEREPSYIDRINKETDTMFNLVDANGDGVISAEELRSHLVADGYTDYAADAVFQSLDSNNDKEISREELREGFLKYAIVREAVAQVVKSLVKQKRWGWTSSQREEFMRRAVKGGDSDEKK